jgi:hypothetical protein
MQKRSLKTPKEKKKLFFMKLMSQVLEQVKQVILWVLISSFYSPLLKSFGWGWIASEMMVF